MIYNTNLRHIEKEKLAKYLDKNRMELMKLIEIGDAKAVRMIAGNYREKLDKTKYRYLYSFASKYCSFSNSIAYPKYDNCVKKALKAYKNKEF